MRMNIFLFMLVGVPAAFLIATVFVAEWFVIKHGSKMTFVLHPAQLVLRVALILGMGIVLGAVSVLLIYQVYSA